MAGREDSFVVHYVRGLGNSARHNSLAYGYSVAVTAAFGMLDTLDGRPGVGEIFLFVVGASAPFAIVNAIVTKGFRERVDREPPVVVALGTSFSMVSISGGVGLAALVGWQLRGPAAWALGALGATVLYLLLGALEMALARTAHHLAGTDNLHDR